MLQRTTVLVMTALLGSVLTSACSAEGVEYPLDEPTLYYPTSIVADPMERGYVYVVTTNRDLRYRTGAIVPLHLDSIEGEEPMQALHGNGAVLVAPHGGQLALRADGQRAVLPIRGDAGLVPFTISQDGSALSCYGMEEQDCSDAAQLFEPGDIGMEVDYEEMDDFFSSLLFQGSDKDSIIVGTLAQTFVLRFDWPHGNDEPVLTFDAGYHNSGSGGLATLYYSERAQRVFGGSQLLNNSQHPSRIYRFDPLAESLSMSTINIFSQLSSQEINAITEDSSGRLLLGVSDPNMLVVVDANITTVDNPYGTVTLAVPLEGDPGDVVYYPRSGANDLAFVSEINRDLIEVVDLVTGNVTGRLMTEAGPLDLELVTRPDGSTWLLVVEFYAHGIAVFDVSSPAVDEFHLMTRLNDRTHSTARRAR